MRQAAPEAATVIAQTKKWLSTIVIGHGLCPFAKNEFDNDRIHYAVIKEPTLEGQMAALLAECAALDKDETCETSLLIFPSAFVDFEDYLDGLALANAVLKNAGYEGIYQLASFHPNYLFEGAAEDDAANYTNRSPYPIIHILREVSVEQALQNHPNPDQIPERNIKLMQKMGLETMKGLLAASYSLD